MNDLKRIFFESGVASSLGVQEIIDNFETIKGAIEESEPDFEYLHKLTGFGSFTVAADTAGLHTMFDAMTHPHIKVTHAYVTLGDNSPQDVIVRLLKSGKKDIAQPITLKATEKSGKMQIYDLFSREIVSRYDSLDFELSASRRVAVTVSFINLKVA